MSEHFFERHSTRVLWLRRVGLALLFLALILLAREAATRSVDFPIYHRAALQLIEGNYDLYPPEAYDGHPAPPHGFRYAPAIAVLFVPFGWLPLELAALAFFVLKLAATWYVGRTVARRVGLPDGRRSVLVVAFLIVGGYLAEEFKFGNAHFFVIALMVFAYDQAEAGRVLAPAAALAVAIAAKITPLALLAYFAWRRRYALCVATVAMVGFLIVLPVVVLGPAGNARQLRAFATYAVEKIDEGGNYSLRGALERYLTPDPGGPTHVPASVASLSPMAINGIWILGLCGLGLAGLAAVWRNDPDPVVRLLEFSIVLTTIVLASPHTQRLHFVALYVPVLVLTALWAGTPPRRERRVILVGLLATAAPASILPLIFGGRRLALIYEAASPYFFGALVLLAVLVVLTVRRQAANRRLGAPKTS